MPARSTTVGTFLQVNRPHTPVRLGTPPAATPVLSFTDFIANLSQWKWELLEEAFQSYDGDTLGQQILQGG
jgi:hypothetical protein